MAKPDTPPKETVVTVGGEDWQEVVDAAIEELPRRRIRLDGDCLQQAA